MQMDEHERQRSDEKELGADKIDEASQQGEEPQPTTKPSQAEGEAETVDASLRQHGSEGEG